MQCRRRLCIGRLIVADEIANGSLGSLVAITATCACVHPPEAPLIGALGAILALLANDWTLGDVVAPLSGQFLENLIHVRVPGVRTRPLCAIPALELGSTALALSPSPKTLTKP